MDLKQRANFVRSMDTIIRALNDEERMVAWLMSGVADGDIDGKETDEDLSYCCEDRTFSDLMALFCRIMRVATTDTISFSEESLKNGNRILFVDGVVSERG